MGIISNLRVGETGVGKMGVGKMGEGKMGVGEMGIPRKSSDVGQLLSDDLVYPLCGALATLRLMMSSDGNSCYLMI